MPISRSTLLCAALTFITVGAYAHKPVQVEVLDFINYGPAGDFAQHGVLADAQGDFYVATCLGGKYGNGALFERTPEGGIKILHSFTKAGYDWCPDAPLSMGPDGSIYGVVASGGRGYDQTVITKYTSTGPRRAEYPEIVAQFAYGTITSGPLAFDQAGDIFAAGTFGGAHGKGYVLKVDTSGQVTPVYSFSGPDGASPSGVSFDHNGNLVGTTLGGGAYGYGTVFRLSLGGEETVLYSFNGLSDGRAPEGPLAEDSQGNLYGLTVAGGRTAGYGRGVGFVVSPDGSERTLFDVARFGREIQPNVTVDADGYAWYVVQTGHIGRPTENGTIVEVTPSGVARKCYRFGPGALKLTQGEPFLFPTAPLVVTPDGVYGTALLGGIGGDPTGGIFKLIGGR